ncbi:HD-GYP domain-containing protein [Halalkalibacter hemicellulosilyticus]|uniref:Uncharacterized protein n=1 Tax=Halalkalibacter hemicellulosilyticusJCM 9152 TaxID=1236971 RepID=W4QE07_9BACI|nr:HD-GYP domain-containing protein [Halalkalibacter hemicellulosilyticus]GAE30290.1 hypothetical protein JCM9152_1694 [Halalkalibacter hemicellulosilyticusJCM 9152]
MRLVSTQAVTEGDILAKTIHNDSGQVLLQEGISLSSRMIGRLHELGISFIYIKDDRTADIEIEEAIQRETKQNAIKTIKREFRVVSEKSTLNKAFNSPQMNKHFSKVIDEILNDLNSHQQALSILSDVITYDNYVFTHSLNVTVYTLRLALELNYNEKQLKEIGLGAILHDVGKMMIPLEILNKPGKLTDEEFSMIKAHASEGFEYLRKQHDVPLLAAHCAFQHHERLDGSGYPRGIQHNEIHEYAKVIAIADVFDAITSQRVYRHAMLPNEALELLYAGAGTQFDQSLVEAFRSVVALYPEGLSVTLSDGREGIVVKQNQSLTTHPIVRIIRENGCDLQDCYDLDLAQQLDVTIVKIESILANTV